MVAYQRSATQPADDSSDDAVARVDATRMRGALARSLAELAPGDRDALLLQALADFTYPEIALALDVPVGTVKSRLHRVREQLAETLALKGVTANV